MGLGLGVKLAVEVGERLGVRVEVELRVAVGLVVTPRMGVEVGVAEGVAVRDAAGVIESVGVGSGGIVGLELPPQESGKTTRRDAAEKNTARLNR